MECRLAGETEVLGENLPQRHFCPSQNPTRPDPGLNPGRRGGKPATNRLSYGSAYGTYIKLTRRHPTTFKVCHYVNDASATDGVGYEVDNGEKNGVGGNIP
jgi:hypothetical protein